MPSLSDTTYKDSEGYFYGSVNEFTERGQGGFRMKIGEARERYSAVLKEYNMQKCQIAKQQKELQQKMKNTENGSSVYAEEAASLELSYQAVSEKQGEYQKYMDQLTQQWEGQFDTTVAKQQAKNAQKSGDEMRKILTIARRIMHGDIVPITDERKLMEFDKDLYQMAKSIGTMKQLEKRKKYKSLWDDETKEKTLDPMEEADGKEAFSNGPEIVSASDVAASAQNSANDNMQ